ncbi:tail assembly protein [Enterobacter hormaechei subsp. xiangfangensis]|uniref:tail assembly protein n=1 Tax=Enterobacter cloacae complex TaxID=354276 RepID=UPI000472B8F2|nr:MULTISPECIES: tail assembly protein [Enterobacter cloacae complex]MBK4415698.1 tail assembly protein [Enterobacter hormaechei]MCU2364200.1 tail assembly protein [Enterobacter hormaechei subsp. xiangfangensis]MCU3720000.1 tail assembly protein [Enterobacter hormaechei subsp. steigerwaltii]DAL46407.1 MAG TPA_asm: tail assembly protein [Caudoviricetes sp.]KTI70593.1 phage tail protein [Enterobacter cloacae subsp. cloacae]
MQEVMSRIELGSVLGKTFGKVHYRLISRVSEAGVALAKTIPGFEQFMISSQRRGLTYSVFKGKKNIGVDDLGFPITGEVIRIVPVIIGSKKAGLIQTILGAVLVVASIWMPGLSIAASNMMFAAGASITLGGVVQMLSPQSTGLASKQSSDNRASYAFGGVTNTAAQGYPVPLLYGRRRIGGAIISAGIYVEDQQ